MGDAADSVDDVATVHEGDARAEPPSHYPPGARVDRYVILESLGQGGMGAIYAAYDSALDRRVALKFLLPRMADEADAGEAQARLLLEARAMARLSHPNVVTLYEVGPAPAGGIYLSMELVEGGTLHAWMKARPRGWREIVTLFCQAGEGLAAAHAAGLIHRDFKLDNVLIRRDGRPQVTDFGLVRAAGEGSIAGGRRPSGRPPSPPGAPAALPSGASLSHLTLTGSMLGTPGYMAPEQYLAHKDIDARADVFGFCAALYRALYGQRPFAGDGLEAVAEATLLGRVQEPPAASDVPGWLRKVVFEGLATAPENRPASMHALLAGLRADPAKQRQKWFAAGLVVLAICGVAGGVKGVEGRRARACVRAADRLGGVWDPARKGIIGERFRATGLAYADDTWARVESRLDAYASSWTSAAYEACAATRIRGEQSEAMMSLRDDCLDQDLDGLRALSDVFASADAKTVENAVNAALGLKSVAPCSDLDQLSAGARLPADSKARAEARDLQAKIAEAVALRLAGKQKPSWARLEQIQDRVNAAAFGPVRVAWTIASARVDSGRETAAVAKDWVSAITMAETYHLDREKAESQVELGGVYDTLGKHEDADLLFSFGTATLARIGGDPMIELRCDALQGTNDFNAERSVEAVRILERAIARAAERHIDAPRQIAQAHSVLAFALMSVEPVRVDDAISHARTAVSMREQAFGPEHPLVASMLTNLAEIERMAGRHEEAFAAVSRCTASFERAIASGTIPASYSPYATALWTEGDILLYLGRVGEAVDLLERARAIDRTTGQSPSLVKDDLDLSEALASLGRGEEAARAGAEAKGLVDADEETSDATRTWLLNVEAALAVDQGKLDDAVALAKRALALSLKGSPDADGTANARLRLAQALGRKGEVAEARDLAEKARVVFARLRDQFHLDAVSALVGELK